MAKPTSSPTPKPQPAPANASEAVTAAPPAPASNPDAVRTVRHETAGGPMITEMGGKVEKPNYSMPGFITEMSVRNPVPQPPPATITERDMPLPGARPPAPVPLPKQSRGRMLNLPTQGVVNGVLVAVVSQVSYSEEAGSVWKLEDGTTVADREISFLQG